MVKRIPVNVAATGTGVSESAFIADGMGSAVDAQIKQIQAVYLADGIPWVVGYSGGKDSTATLQLVWAALAGLPAEQRTKDIHVITNDTLVENPVVAAWANRSLDAMKDRADALGLPILPRRLTPAVHDTFWVNLIGRGYPAPNRRFRWCTERMKISPSTKYIKDVVRSNGEAIIVLGTRKAESAARAARIARYDAKSVREHLSPHNDLASALVYKPIVDWTNDDVWKYLNQYENPWGYSNKDLLTLYKSGSEDAECPVVVDTSTPSCGNSRFGCWTCTVVEKDKSMTAMIQNDPENDWMRPMLDIRDELSNAEKGKEIRDFRRMHGNVALYHGNVVRGPYTQAGRAHWLRRVLEAQTAVRSHSTCPPEAEGIELITVDELHEIRRIWITEKYEYEDLLPGIYQDSVGQPFPGGEFDDQFPFDSADLDLLRDEATTDLQFELLRELIAVEHKYRTQVKRLGILDDIDRAFKRSGYANEEEAIDRVRALTRGRESVHAGSATTWDDMLASVKDSPGNETT